MIRNKKGAEMWQLVAIILAIGVGVLVIMGFWLGWDKIFGGLGLLPVSDAGTFAKGCEAAAIGGLKLDLCTSFKEIDFENGDTMYVNCQYPIIMSSLSVDAISAIEELCVGDWAGSDLSAIAFCNDSSLSGKLKDTDLVNGKTCSDWLSDGGALTLAASQISIINDALDSDAGLTEEEKTALQDLLAEWVAYREALEAGEVAEQPEVYSA